MEKPGERELPQLAAPGALALAPQAAEGFEALRKEDLQCAICLDLLTDPFVTACGHTFCYRCLDEHLRHQKNCPACARFLTPDLTYPNFLLSKIAKRAHSRALGSAPSAAELLQHAISDHKESLSEGDVDALLHQLWEYKQELAERQREASLELLLHFLQSSRQEKVRRLEQLQKELQCLEGDIQRVEAVGSVAGPAGAPGPAGAAGPGRQQQPPAAQQPGAAQPQDVQQQQQVGADAGGGKSPRAAAEEHHQMQHEPMQQDEPQQAHAPQQQQQPAEVQGAAAVAAQAGRPGGGPHAGAPQHTQQHAQQHANLLPHMPHMQHLTPQQAQQLLGNLLGSPTTSAGSAGVSSVRHGGQRDVLSLLRNKKRRIASQFEDLQQCYLRLRAAQLAAGSAGGSAAAAAAAAAAAGGPVAAGAAGGNAGQGAAAGLAADAAAAAAAVGPLIDEGLEEFSRLLSVITRCNKLRCVAEIPRPSPRPGSSSIISSLEFDRQGALFATAGVSKRVSIFDYASVVPAAGGPGVHAPAVELLSRSKLSCLSWNKYIQAHIASSDYEGVVAVWDVTSGALLHEYEAHSKRIWSVDFCEADPALLASGSDDCTVKLWSTKSPSSVAQVDAKANVCAVRWRPGSSHELAVGSADHSAYLYDMRHTAVPLRTFQGHRKAVSYVRFCSAAELVSASTDSTLRLWPVEGGPHQAPGAHISEALRIYEGHSNEKNFVGLAVDGDFLACGSETGDLYVYYKALSKPVAAQAFAAGEDAFGGVPGSAAAHADRAFISAVCWRPTAHTLLAASSQGVVKVYQLTGSGQPH